MFDGRNLYALSEQEYQTQLQPRCTLYQQMVVAHGFVCD